MKIITPKYFGGSVIVFLGILTVAIGLAAILPPTFDIIYGVILLVLGVVLIKIGFIVAKDQPPAGSKIAVDTLRHANMLDEKRIK